MRLTLFTALALALVRSVSKGGTSGQTPAGGATGQAGEGSKASKSQ